MKVVEQAGHFTFLPISSSGTRSSRLHWGQWTVVAIKGLVSPGGVGERGVSRAAHVVSGFDPTAYCVRGSSHIRSPGTTVGSNTSPGRKYPPAWSRSRG